MRSAPSSASGGASSVPERVRIDIAARLGERREAIEHALLARVRAVSDPALVEDPAYVVGLREAVAAGIEFGIASIGAPEGGEVPVPEALVGQARAAARNAISLEVVLRRYAAGHGLLGDHLVAVVQEADAKHAPGLRGLLRTLSRAFDRLVVEVSHAYAEEADSRFATTERRRLELVKSLLAGELADPDGLGYELEAWHLGAVSRGPGAVKSLRALAGLLEGSSLLVVRPDRETAWAWIGVRARPSAQSMRDLGEHSLPADVPLGLGEPGRGMEGWRLSHRQAKAVMAVARREAGRSVRYAEVALLAAALQDDVLARSLREVYLAPLEAKRDRGTPLIDLLHAYFAAGQNASSAAASLGISRQTATIRLRTAEERLGQPIGSCAAELQTALRLRDLG